MITPEKLTEGKKTIRKKKLAMIVCMVVMLCGCGKSAEIQDMEVAMKAPDVEAAKEKLSGKSENMIEETEESGSKQREPEEDQYEIYERFMDGDEALYFPRDLSGWEEFGTPAMLEEGSSYSLDEICNKINRYDNYERAVNEMEQLSYAYIDCGADGEMELAVLFDDLSYWSANYDVNSLVLIIKNIDGRLEMCHVLETTSWMRSSNEYGVITRENSDWLSEYEEVGYLDADVNYEELYHKDMGYWGYGMLDEYDYSELCDAAGAYDLDYTFVVNRYGFEPMDSYPSYEDYLADSKYSFELRDIDSGEKIPAESADPSGYVNGDFLELFENAGISFCSAEEIDNMILDKAKAVGLTEEMLNGKPIQWTALEKKDYDLIYGVEKEEGVSDSERAIKAYRRFLSDRGHFKEILAHSIGWPYENDIRYGMVDGFFIKDMDGDDIPELLIESADSRGAEQALFIYVFDENSGRVRLAHIFDAMGSMVSRELLTESSTSESDWMLYDMRENDLLLFGYNDANQLVWFHHGISADESITMYWCDYSDSDTGLTLHYYYEDYNMWERTPLYEMNEISESRNEAEKALAGYKPFLFYDVTPENIEKYVNVDYLDAGMENYDKIDVIIDKEMFAKSYDNLMDLYSQSMFSGKRFEPDENHEYTFSYDYNLEYLIQLYDRLFG